MNIIDQINAETREGLNTKLPVFAEGDTLRVYVKVSEGNRERTQLFEGVCIARKNADINSNFTVRKISYGEGVERVFPLYSPIIDRIEVARRGNVRRAKLYYLRDLRGKSARITEKADYTRGMSAAEISEVEAAKAAAKAPAPEVSAVTEAADSQQ